MKKKIQMLFMFMFFMSELVLGQTINVKGTVYSMDNEPLALVEVIFKRPVGYKTITDSNGVFSINMKKRDTYSISLKKEGYKQKDDYNLCSIDADNQISPPLKMQELDIRVDVKNEIGLLDSVSYRVVGGRTTQPYNPFLIKTSKLKKGIRIMRNGYENGFIEYANIKENRVIIVLKKKQ